MVFSTAVQSSPLFRIPRSTIPLPKSALRLRDPRIIVLPQQASRSRVPNFPQDDSNLVDDPGKWRRAINSARGGIDDDEDDGNDDDEEERSLDLLVRFLRNMFQKVSKRARTAVRSVLPQAISTKLMPGLKLDFTQLSSKSGTVVFLFAHSYNAGGIFCKWCPCAGILVDF
ncbi:uncharacterized protein LOC129300803 isoform X3 [Prosopis cineraria]|uniref:uncharacterized protein LOC129293878 isoform X3 n=1 Tax=Prosopis cineraria TaxID=364024 RepID=UPI00240EE11A|nr:uncharacterized protein LOC129293878 isoform X3 [Prosopis cineraria]XP_054795377.1 uncharacterized protein LOC129300803 isoform X3 [Prosopis cineraria]